MIFAGPPEDDIDWADVSPTGMVKFLTRAHRLASEVTSAPGTRFASGDETLRIATHRTIDDATKLIESHRYNVAIARMMELTSAARKAVDAGPGPADPAVREAVETLAIMLSLVAPYTAEEMWERLGRTASVAKAGWPAAEPALLVRESVTCVVQVAGKVRDRLEIPPDITEAELERLALASAKVQAALEGRGVRKVIVRVPKIVNIVPA
jgi:leucyl-tRNA synthetase